MIFTETPIVGACVIDVERHEDDRGFFSRTWCRDEFSAQALDPCIAQISISFNQRAGTVRGMHYQVHPYQEVKLVRCTAGSIKDVIVDLRPGSPTFKQWTAVDLSASNHRALYVPAGCAHGFQTLEPETEVLYQISVDHHPESARGVRWNDPEFGIDWPVADAILSPRDASYPDFS